MSKDVNPIRDVSDTALWVAVYRARESQRPDALFKDPLAEKLAGERGQDIAKFTSNSPYTEWAVVIRTHIIDNFIRQAIKDGADTILNLGCGLDIRPYRLELPTDLRWIEVDFPHMIEMKNTELAAEKPKCRLERFAVDLSDDQKRSDFLDKIAGESKFTLVITEGVVPYLSEAQTAALARDLRRHKAFKYWIVEYFAPMLYSYFKSSSSRRQMRNAPFQFMPENWFEFFARFDWKPHEIRYLPEETRKLGRKPPYPWWAKILMKIMPEHPSRPVNKSSGYLMLEQS